MANYNIQISWSGKDSLSDSDPNKIISGSDFNTEFSAIQTAVNSKADLNGNSGEDFSANNLTVSSSITLGGTAITATAAEINLLDGITDVGTNAGGDKTISTSNPSGGSSGDIWYKVAS